MSARSIPPRIRERPDSQQWAPDSLLTLEECCALYWPMGPLSVKSLRHAIARGHLAHMRIARKILVTPAAITEMSQCKKSPTTPRPDDAPTPRATPPALDLAALMQATAPTRIRRMRGPA
jgi:hypothetical protein